MIEHGVDVEWENPKILGTFIWDEKINYPYESIWCDLVENGLFTDWFGESIFVLWEEKKIIIIGKIWFLYCKKSVSYKEGRWREKVCVFLFC